MHIRIHIHFYINIHVRLICPHERRRIACVYSTYISGEIRNMTWSFLLGTGESENTVQPAWRVAVFAFIRKCGLKSLMSNKAPGEGMEAGKKRKTEKVFLVPTPRPGPDGTNTSDWYGRLRVQKLTLSVFNHVKSPTQSFHL